MPALSAAEWSLLIILGVVVLVKIFSLTSFKIKERKKKSRQAK